MTNSSKYVFSDFVKEELLSVFRKKECCKLSELCAIVCYAGFVSEEGLRITSEKDVIAERANRYLKRLFETTGKIFPAKTGRGGKCVSLTITDNEAVARLLACLSVTEADGQMRVNPDIYDSECCLRAFLAGAFLSCGYMRDPKIENRLEFVCPTPRLADDLGRVLTHYDLQYLKSKRSNRTVLYIKNKDMIMDTLAAFDAKKSMNMFYDILIEKEIRTKINRIDNADSANLTKTINAQAIQMEAINKIKNNVGLDYLPANLRQTATLRLEHIGLSMSELAELHDPPISKSGVMHRLAKIVKISEEV